MILAYTAAEAKRSLAGNTKGQKIRFRLFEISYPQTFVFAKAERL
jgi:hypothetical protein